MDPAFRRASVYFDDIEYQRRFEQNLIRYDLKGGTQITKEIRVAVSGGGGGGNGHAFCYWTLEGSNIVRYGGNVGVGVHPHSNDFEVRGNVLVEAIAEQPYVEIRNWSDTEYDPVIHWSLGATPVKKYTMGVDDSDSDAWLLCSGDILTSVEAAATYVMNRDYDGFLYVVDTLNHRLKKHLSADAMTYVSKIGSIGTGNDNFNTPQAICNDGTYLYICDRVNHRIVKRKVSDLSYVTEIGSNGSGDDQFSNPWGICTDGTHVYITDMGNNRIKKHLCADLSYVSKATVSSSSGAPIGPHNFNQPRAICTDGTYLYITQNGGIVARLVILFCSTLSDVLHIHDDGHIDSCTLLGICVTGGFLYILNQNSTDTLKHVYKYTAVGLSYVTHWGVYGTGAGQMTTPLCIDTDGTTLWIFDYAAPPDANRLMKFLLDGTYVATYGQYGTTGDDKFYYAYGLSLGGTISFSSTLYRAPILKAGLDGSYVDAYPLLRARDGFQLMEDGTVAATDYVGLYAPAAITASYSLTFPGTGPAAAGHFAVGATGLITWGQDLITTASPTFVGLTLSGLTASHPVFTDGSSVLVSTGTVPVDHGGTGLAVYVIGDLIYASATTTLARLADVAVASYLRSGGVGAAPLWSTLKLPNAATAFRLPVATSANTIGEVAAVGATGQYLAGATGAIPAWATLNQAAISGLTTADSPTFNSLYLTTYLYAGVDDTTRGYLHAYGPGVGGGAFGGTLACYTGADHDSTIQNYGFMVYEDDLLIGPDTDTDALKLDSNLDLYITAGSLILPASEYLNFGGVIGSGSYGLRDNAGVVEIKNSGGAWASPLTGVTVHNLLSATHGDVFVGVVEEGDIIYGISPLPGWPYCKRIDLPIPTANLTDFPEKVPIIADADIGAECLASGYDIRFTAADGVTLLPYERESFAVAGGEATGIFWVKTNVSMAGTYIWCYYGNAAATDVSTTVGIQWTISGTCVVNNKSEIAKVGGTNNWDSQAYSTESYVDACAISFEANAAGSGKMMGVDSDPSADAGIDIDYAWAVEGGTVYAYESGVGYTNFGAHVPGTILSIVYDGTNVKYYLDDVLKKTVARAVGAALYIDSSFGVTGGIASNITFGPSVDWINYGHDNYSAADGGLTWGAEETTARWTRLAKGAAGQVLTMVSGLPAWVTP